MPKPSPVALAAEATLFDLASCPRLWSLMTDPQRLAVLRTLAGLYRVTPRAMARLLHEERERMPPEPPGPRLP